MSTPVPPDDPAVREREPDLSAQIDRLGETANEAIDSWQRKAERAAAEREALIVRFLLNRADWLEGQPGYAPAADDYRFMAMKIERGDHLKEPTP